MTISILDRTSVGIVSVHVHGNKDIFQVPLVPDGVADRLQAAFYSTTQNTVFITSCL